MSTIENTTRQRIVAKNVETVVRNREFEPKFPKVRALFDGVEFASSFSHAGISPWSSQVVGNLQLREMAAALGINGESIMNIVGDSAKPGSDLAPGGHRIDIGGMPRIFNGEQSYFSARHEFKPINFPDLQKSTLNAFAGQDQEVLSRRLGEIIAILRRYEESLSLNIGPTGKEEISNLPDALVGARKEIFKMVGLEGVEEARVSLLMRGVMADALEILEFEYGKPFYKMPLSPTFIGAGYVKGVDRDGNNRPVTLTFQQGRKGDVPIFTYTGTFTSKIDGRTDAQTEQFRIEGKEIYNAMRAGQIKLNVPLLVLASTTAPQIPHLGAFDWKEYAPEELAAQARFLGLSREETEALYMCTDGGNSFGVVRDKKLIVGAIAGYLSFGAEAIQESLRKDTYIETEWGKLFRP